MTLRAVIMDWGGVMTNPMPDTVQRLDGPRRTSTTRSYAAVMRPWVTEA